MSRSRRVYTIAAALTLAGGAVSSAFAQIPGMPLFTNPRYGTGLRVHVDAGRPNTDDPNGDLTVFQGGVSLAIWRLGINANVGTTKGTAESANSCATSPTPACLGAKMTVSALSQLRIMGGGSNNFSLALFGGASMDLDTADLECSGSCTAPLNNKQINVPVGVSVGYHLDLPLVSSLNVWAAPRMNMTRFVNCSGTCPPAPKNQFGWAVGVDMPLFRVLSIRAAYDTHKDEATNRNVSVIGVGASLGIGGMR